MEMIVHISHCSFGIVIWEVLMQKKPYAGKYESESTSYMLCTH